jgi:uncharacterized protein
MPIGQGSPFAVGGQRPRFAVIDQADILDPTSEANIVREIEQFHRETCHGFGVVSVASLHGVPVEDAGLWLGNRLAFGYPGFNNGLLLLIAPNDRKARIEVGCGLEDVISDAAASEIMKGALTSAFRAGDYVRGIREGLKALMERARRKQIPPDYRPKECTDSVMRGAPRSSGSVGSSGSSRSSTPSARNSH